MRLNFQVLIILSIIVLASGCTSQQQSGSTEYTLEIESPQGEGTVTPDIGSYNYTRGESVELNANPDDDWEFTAWQVNGSEVSSDDQINLSINGDLNVKPIFSLPPEFNIERFDIDKELVKPGEKVTASVTITNTGGKGTYDLVLSSDSSTYHSESIKLKPNESKSLDIEFNEDSESADYTLNLQDKTQKFTVDSATFVSNAEEFNDVRNNMEGDYRLTSNIDLSNIDSEEFVPIGNDNNKFQGILDGQGYAITNYEVYSNDDYVGLFGFIGENGEIKDVNVEDFDVLGEEYVGGLVAVNDGRISGSSSEGEIGGTEHVGGLVGHNWHDGKIVNSDSDSNVSGDRYIGGLVGDNQGLISDSTSGGSVDGLGWVGGIAGRNLGKVVDSSSSAEVSGSSGVAYGEASMEEIEENSEDLEEISYESLMRNPSEHKNKLIYYECLIAQILDNENIRNYHIYTDYSSGYRGTRYWNSGRIKSYWKAEHVEEDYTTFDIEGERLLEEDLVRVYGIFRGLHTYETTQGDTNTVPNVEIRHIEQIENIEG
jgi:hypothetical protein